MPRTILLTCALVWSAGCGGVDPDPNAGETAKWVFSKGGTVGLVDGPEQVARAAELPEEGFAIQRIDLNQKSVSDAELERLQGLKNLEYLGLHSTGITDQGIDHLTGLRSLKTLELSYTQITDLSLSKLLDLPDLQRLFLYGTKVTDEGVEGFVQVREDCKVFR